MTAQLKTISPVDGRVFVERALASDGEVDKTLDAARAAQAEWRWVPLDERATICRRFVDAFLARADEIGPELSWQMGRPVAGAGGEIRGVAERARYMIDIAADALAAVELNDKPGFARFIQREPLGVVLTVPAWNYPYLIAVNSVIPALMAGNAVILKHSSQTPLCAERFTEAFAAAGLPAGLHQHLHLDHGQTAKLLGDSRVDFCAFTGSVGGGRAVHKATAGRFIAVGLELGGKDPAYVRADANIDHAVESLVDGAFYNAGQSCCGIERIYVHGDVYDRFVDAYAAQASGYVLGNPLDEATTLGPLVRTGAADFVRKQVADAIAAGARGLLDPARFTAAKADTPYMAPQVLVDVDHGMDVMMEETFGPVVGIMKVDADARAIALMNDSPFGLTASIWTADEAAARELGQRVETGTLFMNRCDYLDPALAWVGVKDSGRGCTLSRVGYEHLTRPKSFHLRTAI